MVENIRSRREGRVGEIETLQINEDFEERRI